MGIGKQEDKRWQIGKKKWTPKRSQEGAEEESAEATELSEGQIDRRQYCILFCRQNFVSNYFHTLTATLMANFQYYYYLYVLIFIRISPNLLNI